MTWLRSATARVLVLGIALSVLASSLLVPQARAVSAQESPEYRDTVQRAVEEFAAGNYAEARGLFVHAHELYPNARTLRGLGLVAFELRNYGVSVDHLEAALRSQEKPLTAEQRTSTEETLARARAFIARVDVKVSPETARVLVDGMPVELGRGQALVLEVGDHVVEMQASGFLPERRSLSIAGGERLELSVVMRPPESLTAAPLAGDAHDDRASGKRRWYKSPWLWTGVAVVAAGVGVGLAFALKPDTKIEVRDPVKTSNTPKNGTLQALASW